MKKTYRLLVLLVFVTFIFSACGSGGGSEPPVLPTRPAAPTGVTATAGNGQATIAWTAVSGATSYNIYWSITTGVTPANGTKITGATSPHTKTGLTNVIHYFVVTAVNGSGESAASTQASCTPVLLLKAFVTSALGNGNLSTWTDAGGHTGVAAGDNVCQTAANAAGLSGTYKAWLSDSATDAYCHIQGFTGTVVGLCGQGTLPVAAGPWVRAHDGYPFAPTIDVLVNTGQVYAPVRYDENGVDATTPPNFYFTGTRADGTVHFNCVNWTSALITDFVTMGVPAGTTDWWTGASSSSCDIVVQLLCLQTGAGAPLPPIVAPPSAKKVFVTSVQGNGDPTSWADYTGIATGVAAGDTICQNRATAASIPNAANFKAWLSDTATDAIDHVTVTATGPWYRLDGVKIADTITDLATAPLFSAITVDENGAYTVDFNVWSGTDATGIKTANRCVDWTSSAGSDQGRFGTAGVSDSRWTDWSDSNCNFFQALYCFEDD